MIVRAGRIVVWILVAMPLALAVCACQRDEAEVEKVDPQTAPTNADTSPDTGPVSIAVTARRWEWSFAYANDKVADVLVVPVDRRVVLDVTSEDVLHAFFVPSFRLKTDVVPGQQQQLEFVAPEVGVFEIACAEYCGDGHSTMTAELRVVSAAEFAQWLAAPAAVEDPAEAAAPPAVEVGGKHPGACSEVSGVAGAAERTVRYQYDGQGRVTGRSEAWERDGGAPRQVSMTWDAAGNKLTEVTSDGTGEELASLRFEYDDNGKQTLKESRSAGGVHEKTVTVYDDAGLPVRETVTRVSDGTVSGVETFEHDGTGLLRKRHFDSGGTGTIDAILVFDYDVAGLLTSESEQTPDGEVRRARHFEYDDAKRTVKETLHFGPRVSNVIVWEHGQHGPLSESHDNQGDGSVNSVTTWTYDVHGNVLTRTRDLTGKGTTLETTTYTYDCWGASPP